MRNWLRSETAAVLLKGRPTAVGCGPRRPFKCAQIPRQHPQRQFHATTRLDIIKPYLLADIGEGITECQVIQWFVQPGARVEQFDKICEVQSDKASVEITSRFDGVIKKLHYDADDMAKVGKPLVDIDIQSDISPEDEKLTQNPGEKAADNSPPKLLSTDDNEVKTSIETSAVPPTATQQGNVDNSVAVKNGKYAALATPAVRRLTRELRVDVTDVAGTGKDGRVLKEDVQRYASTKDTEAQNIESPSIAASFAEDRTIPLTPVQAQMFKTLTRSLSIPHFLFTDHVDLTGLTALRKRINASANADSLQSKLSPLPFIIKAVSIAMASYPQLNAHMNTPESNPSTSSLIQKVNGEGKPTLTLKASHDIGVAMDTPSGLLVPVVRCVQSHTIQTLAAEIARLAALARAGKLTSAELSGATVTVSNIGSIGSGSGAVAPVIVPPQVAILGVGRSRVVPAFDDQGNVVKKEECIFSWSADHRVLDGAVVARCAGLMRRYLEATEDMLIRMR